MSGPNGATALTNDPEAAKIEARIRERVAEQAHMRAAARVQPTLDEVCRQRRFTFTDAAGRTLIVDNTRVGAPDGREVIGRIKRAGEDFESYACDQQVFREIWLQRTPRWDWRGKHHG